LFFVFFLSVEDCTVAVLTIVSLTKCKPIAFFYDILNNNYTLNRRFGMRFSVFMAVKFWTMMIWVVAQCTLVGSWQRFGGTYHNLFGFREAPPVSAL